MYPDIFYLKTLDALSGAGRVELGGDAMRSLTVSLLLLSALGQGIAPGAEPRVIPLSEVWGDGFWNTKQLRDIDTLKKKANLTREDRDKSLFWQIHYALTPRLPGSPPPAEAFLVDGTGQNAFLAARDVLARGSEPSLTADKEKSLIFFAYASGGYDVIIESIVVDDYIVTLTHRLEHRSTMDVKRYIAIVPLGILPSGPGDIRIKRSAIVDRKGNPLPYHPNVERIVCRSSEYFIPKQE